jgi:hypothetical protein
MVASSQRTIDFVIEAEVSSRAYYEKRLRSLEWPGGASGPTGGIGYDFGYQSQSKITRDWQPRATDANELAVLVNATGKRGYEGKVYTDQYGKQVDLTWEDASFVFLHVDMPETERALFNHIPKAADLPPDCIGVLCSLAYNRGQSWDNGSDRYREMRAIKQYIQDGKPGRVSNEIRAMKRLWPSDDKSKPDRGLRARRDKEAAIWDEGLRNSQPAAKDPVAKPTPPRTMPTPDAPASSKGAAGGTIIAGGAAATKAKQDHVISTSTLIFICIGIAFLAFVVYKALHAAHAADNPLLARAKDAPPPEAPAVPAVAPVPTP